MNLFFIYFNIFVSIFILANHLQAQTGGPVQSDYVGSPAPAGPNVDEFTGQFSFGLPLLTVPGPDGSSFPITLSYRSGANPNDVPSWVGYGWSLNAGAIIRETRGFPDDYCDTVVYWNKIHNNYTVTAALSANLEVLSKFYYKNKDKKDTQSINPNIGYDHIDTWNNNSGYKNTSKLTSLAKGFGTIGYNWAEEESGWFGSIDPLLLSNGFKLFDINIGSNTLRDVGSYITSIYVNQGLYSFGKHNRPIDIMPYDGLSDNYSVGINGSFPMYQFGYKFGVRGTYTMQNSIDRVVRKAYGYLYSEKAVSSSEDDELKMRMMDYSRERTIPYRINNQFLPAPIGQPDNFTLTGIAGGGSMRLYSTSPGHYFPPTVTSYTRLEETGYELTLGARLGIGANFEVGYAINRSESWPYDYDEDQWRFSQGTPINQQFYFRFNNDFGGNNIYSNSDDPVRSGLSSGLFNTGTFLDLSEVFGYDVEPPTTVRPISKPEANRNVFVDFRFISDVKNVTDMNKKYYVTSNSAIDTSNARIQNKIGEIVVNQSNGSRFIYGIPVFSRHEKNLSVGLNSEDISLPTITIKNNHLAYSSIAISNSSTIIGEERKAPYPSAYLLTAITTADYIDVDGNGLSNNDIGGWTKFNYKKYAGVTYNELNNYSSVAYLWYSWRYPYEGFMYSKGSLSDGRDNMGAYSTGEHELYYLESIETKTHKAVFVNGSRKDAFPSKREWDFYDSENAYFRFPIAHSRVKEGVVQLLDEIKLYAKNNAADSLLSTVFFEYDYSLRENMPNSNIKQESDSTMGMLTLKKVWMQSQGLSPARIHPYHFDYEYKKSSDYPLSIISQYPQITSFADSLSSTEQNPKYSFHDIDRWGGYQENGANRYARLNPWVNQYPNPNSFDPAAWQLKRIQYPMGNEIQIQYEQNEYAYVQNRPAMAMVSLIEYPTSNEYQSFDNSTSNNYFINLKDIGISDTNRSAVVKFWSFLRSKYLNNNKTKVYFKFLYALHDTTVSIENSESTSDYISGYVKMQSIDTVKFSDGKYGIKISLKSDNGDGQVPKTICQEYVKKNRWGLLSKEEEIEQVFNYDEPAMPTMIWDVISTYRSADWYPENYCKAIDYPNSYIRLPLVFPKKGGGIRVKRLLNYDPGIESVPALYGTEYLYEKYDEDRHEMISSGIASNEPQIGREENSLVEFMSIDGQPKLENKSIYGYDRECYEAPFGESFLPSPSIGYSRIIKRNIHKGKTNLGFSISEYYTTRDYPYDKKYQDHKFYTDIDKKDAVFPQTSISDETNLGDIFFVSGGISFFDEKIYLTQGYAFNLNSMNGKQKNISVYSGDYFDPDTWITTASNQYSYYEPTDSIPLFQGFGKPIAYGIVGKEMDVAMESRSMMNDVYDLHLSGDLTFPWTFTDAQLSAAANGTIAFSKLNTHVITKVISYPAILKNIVSYADGVYHLSENIAFSPETGEPVITKTYDSYNKLSLGDPAQEQVGAYHSYSFPASLQYPQLGKKSQNARTLLTSTSAQRIILHSNTSKYLKMSGGSACEGVAKLTSGDFIVARKKNDSLAGFYHIGVVKNDSIELLPVNTNFASLPSLSTTQEVDIEILESGYKNQLGASVGGITTYGEQTEDILAGTNVSSYVPTDMIARQDFADLLNSKLNVGGGILYPADYRSLGLKFQQGETCDSLTEAIRIELSNNQMLLSRGTFTINDSICNSHPMVTWLNDYLDTIWGYAMLDTHDMANSNFCSGTDLWRKSATYPPPGYTAIQDTFLNKSFNFINGWKIAQNTSKFITKGSDDFIYGGGFRTDTTQPYATSGQFHLQGEVATDFLKTWMGGDCSGGINPLKVRRIRAFNGSINDTAINRANATAAIYHEYDEFTSEIGKFDQDVDGYLIYQDILGGYAPLRAFGIRFYKSDTTNEELNCQNAFLTSDSIGEFAINRYGDLVYRCHGGSCPEQEITCLKFCGGPTRFVQDTLKGVIAASTVVLDDKRSYSGQYYSPSSGVVYTDANIYERAERGQWDVRTGFAYRTPIIGGSDATTGERNYKSAGVFENFTLFDWQKASANDPQHWIRQDTITKISLSGKILETEDQLGLYSTTQYTEEDKLPILVAANSDFFSVGYKDFELLSYSTPIAHSGVRSLICAPSGYSEDFGMQTQLTQRLIDKGLLVRFWGHKVPYVAGNPNFQFVIEVGSTTISSPVKKVAQSGEWTLYEAIIKSLDSLSPINTNLLVYFNNLGNDTAWVDDLRLQPLDAEMICYSYDRKTLRPIATFDADHFGAYNQYNAKGEVVRTIVETARGFKTVADAYVNIPSTPRTGESIANLGSTPSTSIKPSLSSDNSALEIPEGIRPNASGAQFDVLDVELSPNKESVKIFGVDKDKLLDEGSVSMPDIKSFIPDLTKYQELLEKIEQLDSTTQQLNNRSQQTLTINERQVIEKQRHLLIQQRQQLLQEYGVNEEELEQLFSKVKELKMFNSNDVESKEEKQ